MSSEKGNGVQLPQQSEQQPQEKSVLTEYISSVDASRIAYVQTAVRNMLSLNFKDVKYNAVHAVMYNLLKRENKKDIFQKGLKEIFFRYAEERFDRIDTAQKSYQFVEAYTIGWAEFNQGLERLAKIFSFYVKKKKNRKSHISYNLIFCDSIFFYCCYKG